MNERKIYIWGVIYSLPVILIKIWRLVSKAGYYNKISKSQRSRTVIITDNNYYLNHHISHSVTDILKIKNSNYKSVNMSNNQMHIQQYIHLQFNKIH